MPALAPGRPDRELCMQTRVRQCSAPTINRTIARMEDAFVSPGLLVSEVDGVQRLAGRLFAASFRGTSPPDRGRHFVTMAELAPGRWALLCYVHFQPFGDTCLGGGACTDVSLLRELPQSIRDELRAAGGPYAQLLRYALGKMAKENIPRIAAPPRSIWKLAFARRRSRTC